MTSKLPLLLLLASACSSAPRHQPQSASVTERVCPCDSLYTREVKGRYLQYYTSSDSIYTGKCTLTRENGNEIIYRYAQGQIMEIREFYPGGIPEEEMIYDTSGMIVKRVRYYRNGHPAYIQVSGNHGYESFYDNGRIARKGGYGFTPADKGNRFYDLDTPRLFDSIWKENGDFDSVYRYTKGSITY